MSTEPSAVALAMADIYLRPPPAGLAGHLRQRYGLAVTGVERLDSGVYRIDGPEVWVARVFSRRRPLDRVEGDADVLRLMEAHDLPAERLAHAEPVSVLDGEPVLVTRFVAGSTPRPSPSVLGRLADLLGRIHALPPAEGRAARAGGSLHHVPFHEGLPSEDVALAADLLDDIAERIPPKGRSAFDRLRGQVAEARSCDDLPHALVHPDPVLRNVVSTPDRRLVLIDWAGSGRGPRIASLAPVIAACGTTRGWDEGRLAVVAEAYGAHVRLGPDEVDRIADALWARALWLAAWRYWTGTVTGKPPKGTEWWIPKDRADDRIGPLARAAFGMA